MTTYKIATAQNKKHTTGMTILEVMKFADELRYDTARVRHELQTRGSVTLRDDVGSFKISREAR